MTNKNLIYWRQTVEHCSLVTWMCRDGWCICVNGIQLSEEIFNWMKIDGRENGWLAERQI